MDDNWIVENLEGAFATWNSKLTEIWSLVSETPQHFKGGAIWELCQNINTALQAIGYGLLILFFAVSIFRSTANFQDFRRPEQALRYFIRFVAAKTAVTYGMDIMTTLFTICGGIVSAVAGNLGNLTGASVALPEEIKTAVAGNDTGQRVHHGAVLCDDTDRVQPILPALYVHGACAYPTVHLCGRYDFKHRAYLHQKLSWRVHGGRGHRACLHDILRICQRRFTWHCRPECFSGDDGMELSRGNYLQYAGAGGIGQGRRPHCEGNDGTVKVQIMGQIWR